MPPTTRQQTRSYKDTSTQTKSSPKSKSKRPGNNDNGTAAAATRKNLPPVTFRRATLTDLPTELLIEIFYLVDLNELRECLRVCKRFHAILDRISTSAQYCFRGYRQRLQIPDPAPLELKEVELLEIFFGMPKCCFCWSRKCSEPIWQFHGLRFCYECLVEQTISIETLFTEFDERQFRHCPFYIKPMSTGNMILALPHHVIMDYIPDDDELEMLDRSSKDLRDVHYLMEMTFDCINSQMEKYQKTKSNTYKLNAYKWLIYKYPFLEMETLKQWPELNSELAEGTHLYSNGGRERLGKTALEAYQKRFPETALQRLRECFANGLLTPMVSSPRDDVECLRSYDPFWRDGILTRKVLPALDEIVDEFEKHAVGYKEYLELMDKRIKMMATYAHDLPMKDIKVLMETNAYKKVDEDEFVKECERFRVYYQGKRKVAASKINSALAEITSASCFVEFISAPAYTNAIDEEAFDELVTRIKNKQVELKEKIYSHIRYLCESEQVYDLVYAAAIPQTTYFSFLEITVLEQAYRDTKYSERNYSWRWPFTCQYCLDEELFSFKDVLDHSYRHCDRVESFIIAERWLNQCKLASRWFSQMDNVSNSWSMDEKLITMRTFCDWEDSDSSFAAFERHVEETEKLFVNARRDYHRALGIFTEVAPDDSYEDIISGKKQNKLILKARAMCNFGYSKNVFALMLDNAHANMYEALQKRIDSFRAATILRKHVCNDFRQHVDNLQDSLQTLNSQKEADDLLVLSLEKLEKKWNAIDNLFVQHGIADSKDGFEYRFNNQCEMSYGIDAEVDEEAWVEAIQKVLHVPAERQDGAKD